MKINKDKDGVLPWTVDQVALGQAIVFWWDLSAQDNISEHGLHT